MKNVRSGERAANNNFNGRHSELSACMIRRTEPVAQKITPLSVDRMYDTLDTRYTAPVIRTSCFRGTLCILARISCLYYTTVPECVPALVLCRVAGPVQAGSPLRRIYDPWVKRVTGSF